MKTTRAFLLLLAACGASWAGTVFTLSPPAGPITAGETFTVDILATSDGIYAFSFDTRFDASLLFSNGITGVGDFAGIFFSDAPDNTLGAITNVNGSLSGLGLATPTGTPVAQFSFTALATGEAFLQLSNFLVVNDPDSFGLDPDVTSSPVNISIVDAPEPAPCALLLLGGLMLARRYRAAPADSSFSNMRRAKDQ